MTYVDSLKVLIAAVVLLIVAPLMGQADEPLALISREEKVRCLAILRSGLTSDEFWPAMHAAEALTLAGQGAEVVAALRDRLPLETHDQRRCGLARELVRARDRSPLPVLVRILNDESSIGRVHAAESLYKLGEAGPDTGLARTMSQTNHVQLRLMSAAALARRGSTEALEILRKALLSEDRLARNTACFALARLGTADDLDPLRECLALETDAAARANLINALACLGDDRGLQLLKVSLDSNEAGIRTAAAEHVGHARCLEYRPRLVELLDDATLDVRVRSAQSIIALSLPPAKWRLP